MRVEIDLPNPDGLLREGMYGRATITLAAQSSHLTLPVACVLERTGKGKGTVQVVRDGKVRSRRSSSSGPTTGPASRSSRGWGTTIGSCSARALPLEDGMRVDAEDRG